MGVLVGTGFERLAREEGMTKRFVPIALAWPPPPQPSVRSRKGRWRSFHWWLRLVEVRNGHGREG